MPLEPKANPYACVVALHQCRKCRKMIETPIADCNHGLLRHCQELMLFKGHVQPCACPSCKAR